MDETPHVTLGRNVLPSNYKIRIEPNMSGPRYSGEEDISVQIIKATNRIRLNAKQLAMKGAFVTSKGKKQKASIRLIKDSEELELAFRNKISGKASIWISFEGAHNEKLYGFYRSRYEYNGKPGTMLTTQFEAADARTAFPCFDEPEFKATFDLSLVIGKKLDAVSNMEIKSAAGSGSKKVVTFATTPKMSTYLLYIGVGSYDFLESKLGKLKIRVVTVPGKGALAGTAMDYARRFIRFYERYFGIKYPLPKIDLLAIPDFAAGAMENWGALTFREAELICDPKKTASATLQRIAEIVAHELAHQWFGDLVTMKWWDDIWLNESFATYMSYKAMDAVFPEWKAMDRYLNLELARAYAADGYRDSHPVSQPVRNIAQIQQMFDDIGYRKGGSVLRMMDDYVGGEIFRRGLNIYLRKNSYSNATRHDLWGALELAAKAAGKSLGIDGVASYWINTQGYPIIDVKEAGGSLFLSQKRFTISGSTARGRWPVPVHYSVDGKAPAFLMMRNGRRKLGAGCKAWVKLNSGQYGFYRVRYPNGMIDSLGSAIKEGKIGAVDAWGIENDLFAGARAGEIPLSEYMDFVRLYLLGAGPPADANISAHVDGLRVADTNISAHDGFRILSFFTKWRGETERLTTDYNIALLNRVGWTERKEENTSSKIARGDAMMRLVLVRNPKAIKMAGQLFGRYRRGATVDPNLKNAMFMSVAVAGGAKQFDELVALYKRAKLPADQRALLWSFSAFGDVSLLKRALAFSFSKDVRLQDSGFLPQLISRNPIATDLILEWTIRNWSKLIGLYVPDMNTLPKMVMNLGLQHNYRARRKVVQLFSKKANRRQDIELSIKNVLEAIDANIRFIKKNE